MEEEKCSKPSTTETPLYVSARRAAQLTGISEHRIREWLNDTRDPLPHIRCGNRRLIRAGALPEYLKRKEAV